MLGFLIILGVLALAEELVALYVVSGGSLPGHWASRTTYVLIVYAFAALGIAPGLSSLARITRRGLR
jgi:hypothetical protein